MVAKVLSSLTSLCELGHFQKMHIWKLMTATLGFLFHPNVWILHQASKALDATVQWAMKADKTNFWHGGRRTSAKVESPRESVMAV
ncbi:hypothetical protein DXG01_014728, partial [Tephrocybe rancida]